MSVSIKSLLTTGFFVLKNITMKVKVSELIVKYIERLGIETIFGMPSAHILPVYDSLYDSKVKMVLAKHEQGAAFMAGGCARATGETSTHIFGKGGLQESSGEGGLQLLLYKS